MSNMTISRDEELRKIEEFVRKKGVNTGPTAFVAPSIHATVFDRTFKHSDVKSKYEWMIKNSNSRKKKRK